MSDGVLSGLMIVPRVPRVARAALGGTVVCGALAFGAAATLGIPAAVAVALAVKGFQVC